MKERSRDRVNQDFIWPGIHHGCVRVSGVNSHLRSDAGHADPNPSSTVGARMSHWVISHITDTQSYWSQTHGWTDFESATRFASLDKKEEYLPIGGIWVEVQDERSSEPDCCEREKVIDSQVKVILHKRTPADKSRCTPSITHVVYVMNNRTGEIIIERRFRSFAAAEEDYLQLWASFAH